MALLYHLYPYETRPQLSAALSLRALTRSMEWQRFQKRLLSVVAILHINCFSLIGKVEIDIESWFEKLFLHFNGVTFCCAAILFVLLNKKKIPSKEFCISILVMLKRFFSVNPTIVFKQESHQLNRKLYLVYIVIPNNIKYDTIIWYEYKLNTTWKNN